MTETSPQKTAPTPTRAVMPDLIRAFALVGIALVNVLGFAWPVETGLPLEARSAGTDGAAYFTTHALFTMKSYPLFSMMFGAGLAYQMRAADRAEKAFAPRYFRRMLGLWGLGLIHFIFFWIGDILITYALLGAVFFFMRDVSVRSLIVAGCLLIAANAALFILFGLSMWAGETFAPDQMPTATDFEPGRLAAMAAFADGTFWQAAAYRAQNLPILFLNNLTFQGLGVLGYFCFGLAAVKAHTIDAPDAKIWRLSRWVFLPIGLLGSAAGAWILHAADLTVLSTFFFGFALLMAFSPFVALGYAGLIAKLSTGAGGPVRRFIARAGSASLTAYLLQSVLFAYMFTAYGLGQYGKLGAGAIFAIALAIAISSILFTGVWRSVANRGPVESLLRRFTYWGNP